jgi:hypothetical protein
MSVNQADLEIAFAQLKESNQISKKWLIPRIYPLWNMRTSQQENPDNKWLFFRWLLGLIPLLIEAYLFIFDRWRAWVTANLATPIISILSFYMARDLGGHIFNYQDNTMEVGKWIDEHVYKSSRENVFGEQHFDFCKEGSWYTYVVRNKAKKTSMTTAAKPTLVSEPFFSIQWYSMKRRLCMSPSNLLTYVFLLLGFALTFFLPLKGFIDYVQTMLTTDYYVPGNILEFLFLFRGFLSFPLITWIISKILSNFVVFVDQKSYQERVYNAFTYIHEKEDLETEDAEEVEEKRNQLIQQSEHYTLWITLFMGASFGFMLFLIPVWFVFGKILQFIGYRVGSGRNNAAGNGRSSGVIVVANNNDNNKTN